MHEGVAAVGDVVADVDVAGAAAVGLDFSVDWGVAVAEDAVVVGGLLELLLAPDDDAFAVVAEVLLFLVGVALAAVSAPAVGYPEGEAAG